MAYDDLFVSDEGDVVEYGHLSGTPNLAKTNISSSRSPKRKKGSIGRKKTKRGTSPASSSSSGEHFNFDDISSGGESEVQVKRRGRPRKEPVVSPLTSSKRSKSAKDTDTNKEQLPRARNRSPLSIASTPVKASPAREIMDLTLIASASEKEGTTKRTRGRPRKESRSTTTTPVVSNVKEKGKAKAQSVFDGSVEREEVFDLNSLTAALRSLEGLPKKKRGRPRKESSAASGALLLSTNNNGITPNLVDDQRYDSRSNLPSNNSEALTQKRGRPRKEVKLSTFVAVVKDVPDAVKRRPGRPRKTASPITTPGNDIRDDGPVSVNQKLGRLGNDVGLSLSLSPPPSSIRSWKTGILSQRSGLHTQPRQVQAEVLDLVDTSSGESFDFTGLDSPGASDEDFGDFARCARTIKGQKPFYTPRPLLKMPGMSPSNSKAPQHNSN